MSTELAPTPNPLMSLNELSGYLQVMPKTIHNWRAVGKGPRGMKVGGALRFRLADVDAWLDAQYETNEAAA